MNTFATVIVNNATRESAQDLLGNDFFNVELRGTFGRKFWLSSGAFLTSEYNSIIESGLPFIVENGNDWKTVLAENSLTRVVIEED